MGDDVPRSVLRHRRKAMTLRRKSLAHMDAIMQRLGYSHGNVVLLHEQNRRAAASSARQRRERRRSDLAWLERPWSGV